MRLPAASGYIHITPLQVYDELLGAALKAQGCGPRALPLQGPWRWLLDEFAATYGVRPYSAQVCGVGGGGASRGRSDRPSRAPPRQAP